MEFTNEEKEYIKKYEEKFHVLTNEEKEYIIKIKRENNIGKTKKELRDFFNTNEEKEYITKYEEKYGKLSEEGKKHVLKHRNSLSEEELDKMLEEWVGK